MKSINMALGRRIPMIGKDFSYVKLLGCNTLLVQLW